MFDILHVSAKIVISNECTETQKKNNLRNTEKSKKNIINLLPTRHFRIYSILLKKCVKCLLCSMTFTNPHPPSLGCEGMKGLKDDLINSDTHTHTFIHPPKCMFSRHVSVQSRPY